MPDINLIKKAYDIASRDLRSCYTPDGIVAGRKHFNSYWSRDGFWGVFGALELHDFEQSKKHLELFMSYQRPNGQFPVRIAPRGLRIGPFRFRQTSLKGIFRVGEFLSTSFDPTSLFIMAVWQYYRHTLDKDFLKKSFKAVYHAITWNQVNDIDGDGLIEAPVLSDWMDSILKKGDLLNINVIHQKALDNFASICRVLGKEKEAQNFENLSRKSKSRINEIFWNGSYYVDWIDKGKVGGFSSDGNVLAILFGIADEKQSLAILETIEEYKLDKETPLKTVYPLYQSKQIAFHYRLFGLAGYHNKYIWLWLACLNALNKFRLGKKTEAFDDLEKIAKIIVKYKVVYEIYTDKGEPVETLFYSSERPFAWNAACFIYAVKSMEIVGEHKVKTF